MNDRIITSFVGITGITGSNYLTAQVDPDKLNLPALKRELFPEKKVIKEKPPTIEQMVASAQSRLKVFIDSETVWQKKQLTIANKKRFQSWNTMVWMPELVRVQPMSMHLPDLPVLGVKGLSGDYDGDNGFIQCPEVWQSTNTDSLFENNKGPLGMLNKTYVPSLYVKRKRNLHILTIVISAVVILVNVYMLIKH